MTPDQPMFTAADVPALRRILIAWVAEHGSADYTNMINLGRQQIRPNGPASAVGPRLAADEVARLTNADLWYIDPGLCDLVQTAHHTMPRFAPIPPDLPSRSGFAVFAAPIATRNPEDLTAFAKSFGLGDNTEIRRLIDAPIQIAAVSWGPCPYRAKMAPAGAVWMSFYSVNRIPDGSRPPLLVDNEAIVPWTPDGADPGDWLLTSDGNDTHGWAQLVFAAFRLATQGGLVEEHVERPPRPERRRTQRAGLPERDVRIVRLRRTSRSEDGVGGSSSNRTYHHRWVVRGHWRNQPWGQGRQLRRPMWILPHVKGPEGAPLIGGERVTVVTGGQPPHDGGAD